MSANDLPENSTPTLKELDIPGRTGPVSEIQRAAGGTSYSPGTPGGGSNPIINGNTSSELDLSTLVPGAKTRIDRSSDKSKAVTFPVRT